MDQDPLLKIRAEKARLAAAIDAIFLRAEEEAAPLKSKLERLTIAEEVVSEIDKDSPPDAPARPKPLLRRRVIPATRDIILQQMELAGVPMSKAELLDRLTSRGYEVVDATVGSTLSRMTADGLLVKDESNRYGIKAASVELTSGEDQTNKAA